MITAIKQDESTSKSDLNAASNSSSISEANELFTDHSESPWSQVYVKKLTVAQIVKKCSTFCGI